MAVKLNLDTEAEATRTAGKGGTPWRIRIIEFLASKDGYTASIVEVLEATDDKYSADLDASQVRKRKHCLDSQKTYAWQDEGVDITYEGDNMRINAAKDEDGILRPVK